MPDANSLDHRPEKSGCVTIVVSVLVAAVVTLALTLLVLWRMAAMVTDETRDMAKAIAENFQKTLNFTPEVRVDSVVIVAASTPAFELVTLKKQVLVRHSWSNTWLHSTKNLEIEATFTAAAGFDLNDPLRIQINPETKWFSAQLPQPKILSIGMGDVRVLRDEDGLWNKLTEQDRQEAFRALEKKARAEFASSNILAEAGLEGEKRVREVLEQSSRQIEFKPAGPAP